MSDYVIDEEDKTLARELAGVMADEIVERMQNGWPLLLDPQAVESLKHLAAAGGTGPGSFLIGYGPMPWRISWQVHPGGMLTLSVADEMARPVWSGVLRGGQSSV